MNCTEFQEGIWGYLLGDIPMHKKCDMDKHFKDCDSCKAKVEERRQYNISLNSTLEKAKTDLGEEVINTSILHKLKVRKKITWTLILKEHYTKRIAVSLGVLGLSTVIAACTFAYSRRPIEIEKWVGKYDNIKANYISKENTASSEATEVRTFDKRAEVSEARHIDLGDSKHIIDGLKNSNGSTVRNLHSDRNSIVLGIGTYVLNYEFGKGINMAIDLSKLGIKEFDWSKVYISPNKSFVEAVDTNNNKVYVIDVKRSSITEIKTKLRNTSIQWSSNEKYFAINNELGNARNTVTSFGGKVDDNGVIRIASYNDQCIAAINDEGFFQSLGYKLKKIDLSEEVEIDLSKVIGERPKFIIDYYFEKGKNFVFVAEEKDNKYITYICEIDGKEVKVIKRFEEGSILFCKENGEGMKGIKTSANRIMLVYIDGSNITQEIINGDVGAFGRPSPNYYSYIDTSDRSKTLIKKSSDNSIISSFDIPFNEGGCKYLDGDNLLMMNSKLSDSNLKLIKFNVKTKKIEEFKLF